MSEETELPTELTPDSKPKAYLHPAKNQNLSQSTLDAVTKAVGENLPDHEIIVLPETTTPEEIQQILRPKYDCVIVIGSENKDIIRDIFTDILILTKEEHDQEKKHSDLENIFLPPKPIPKLPPEDRGHHVPFYRNLKNHRRTR